MPNLISSLIIDRVDLVDEGANSASFIELFKRKESKEAMDVKEIISKMKPEHAEVVQTTLDTMQKSIDASTVLYEEVTKERDTANVALEGANTALEEANTALEKAKNVIALYKAADYCTCDGDEDEDGVCESCNKPKGKAVDKAGFDEEETLKSMPEAARELFYKMRDQKNAAEEAVRKAKEAEEHAEAVSKAATLKSLPIETEKLVSLIKGGSPELIECLTTINTAIDGVVLNEVGKSKGADVADSSWAKIEAEAEVIAKRDGISKQKAITAVLKEKPELYNEYLKEV